MNETFSNVLRDIFPAIIPEIVLVSAAALIFLGGTIRADRNLWGFLSLIALAIAGLACFMKGNSESTGDYARSALYAASLVFDHLSC
jgi:NADH:ubiquinone oxidoreductase subunit 2 (subunit N)